MIQLTRLDQRPFVLNAEVIAYIDATPDTVVTLTNGERLVVRERVEDVVNRVLDYRRRVDSRARGTEVGAHRPAPVPFVPATRAAEPDREPAEEWE